MANKKVALIILDGWGHGDKTKSDAIHNANTPFVDSLYTKYAYSTLITSGEEVDNWNEFPNDGKVIRVDDNKEYSDLGYTSHHPRGAYALKTREEGIETTLLDVVWQTGKSGKVTPVAILDPIKIDDAVISRATLNNIAYIKSLNLEIGCRVKVIRAGKIIPRVIERVS